MDHKNRMIFPGIGKAKFFYLNFISAKLNYSKRKVSFAAVEIEHQNRGIGIRAALKSQDFSKH